MQHTNITASLLKNVMQLNLRIFFFFFQIERLASGLRKTEASLLKAGALYPRHFISLKSLDIEVDTVAATMLKEYN